MYNFAIYFVTSFCMENQRSLVLSHQMLIVRIFSVRHGELLQNWSYQQQVPAGHWDQSSARLLQWISNWEQRGTSSLLALGVRKWLQTEGRKYVRNGCQKWVNERLSTEIAGMLQCIFQVTPGRSISPLITVGISHTQLQSHTITFLFLETKVTDTTLPVRMQHWHPEKEILFLISSQTQ